MSKKAPTFREEMNCEVCIYIINKNNITERMRRTNTVIAGKETKAKLTSIGKAFVNCWNYLSIIT